MLLEEMQCEPLDKESIVELKKEAPTLNTLRRTLGPLALMFWVSSDCRSRDFRADGVAASTPVRR